MSKYTIDYTVKYRIKTVIDAHTFSYMSLEEIPEHQRAYIAMLDAAADEKGRAEIEGVGNRAKSIVHRGAGFYQLYV